jgi:imidazolonepropionase-like amidohydrolase
MKPLIFCICLSSRKTALTVCLTTLIFCIAFAQNQTYDLGIVAGTLINGTGTNPLENKLILINQGKIIDIVDAERLKDYNCKTLINAHDKFIIPGLFDMHSHVTNTHMTLDTTNGNWQHTTIYNRAAAEWGLRSLLYFGVTNVREAGAFLNAEMQLKQDLEANKIQGPHMFTCGPFIESGKPLFLTLSTVVNTEQEAIAEVQRQAKAGVDVIKILLTVPPNLTKVIIEEGHRNKKKVIGHLGTTSWSDAVKFGIDGLVHPPTFLFKNFDPSADSVQDLLKIMKERKIENDPTIYTLKCWFQKDSAPAYLEQTLPETTKSGWAQEKSATLNHITNSDFDTLYKRSLNYVKTAYELGVDILAGSDFNVPGTFPGYSLHKELQELSKAGIPNDSLIKIATYKAAEWLGVLEKTGTVEEGKDADIIILNKNPLLKIENTLEIDKVIQHGKVIKRDGLLTSGN